MCWMQVKGVADVAVVDQRKHPMGMMDGFLSTLSWELFIAYWLQLTTWPKGGGELNRIWCTAVSSV